MENTIHLEESQIIGTGGYRTVYAHPDYPNQCFKVQKNKKFKENNVDIKYHLHLKNRKASFQHIAQFQGEVNTNKGKAVIFTLVKDYDNTVSRTLRYYLEQNNDELDKSIAQNLLQLRQYLLKERVVFVDVNPANIVLCKTNSTDIKLIIIDALGSRNLIPIAHYINFIAVKMINRRWCRSIKHEYRQFEYKEKLKPLFDSSLNGQYY